MLALFAGMSGTAHLVQAARRSCAPMFRQRAQKGTARASSRSLTRRLLTKIHLKFDFDGLPLTFHLTDIGPDITPRAVLSDKGDGAKANREAARRRGICPAIPYRENAVAKPAFFPKTLYKGRARAEQGVGKFKRFKCVALRCERAAQNFAAFISLAGTFILVKSVHTT
jgi:hypothetical protein